ncbi:MAG: winged helix-turn-helix domain-containing protein [Candidatus Eremiobacteraeota bacterium]|nr:winged helix-turn-helix domain-containing protein [Candidatus Eremiobacteraeota bacterium]
MMDGSIKHVQFGPFELDAKRLTLCVKGQPLALGPRVVETLLALVERAGEVLTKDEILERVWRGADVEEGNLAQNVYLLRRTFQAYWRQRVIETVPRRGYRFVPEVRFVDARARPAVKQSQGWTRPISSLRRPLAAAGALVLTLSLATASRGPAPAAPPHLSQQGAQLYQLGHYYWTLRTRDGFAKSLRYFAAVTQVDPRSPLGYAGLAEAYAVMPSYNVNVVPAKVAMKRAWSYTHEALARDPLSSEAHAVLGYLQREKGTQPEAGRSEFERAVALDPNNAAAHLWLGGMFSDMGRAAPARSEFEIAERLEPASPATEAWLASSFFASRDYAAAVDRLHRALDLDPLREDALQKLGAVEAQRGHLGSALDAALRLATACRCSASPAIVRAYAYAKSHRTTEARAAMSTALRNSGKMISADVAFVYAALGDRDRALWWLRRSVHEEPGAGAALALDPRLDPVRNDPRFARWMHVVGAQT